MNFRKYLKHLYKNIQKQELTLKELRRELESYGLTFLTFEDLNIVLIQPHAKAKGRHFLRLGGAAKRKGKLVFLKDISDYAQRSYDLRTVPFYDFNNMEWHDHGYSIEAAIPVKLRLVERMKARIAVNLEPSCFIDPTYEKSAKPESEKSVCRVGG